MTDVLVPLANGCEELEAVTVIDLLRRAGVNVFPASLDNDRTISASRGVKLVADMSLDDVFDHSFDMIVLPGGLPGATYLNEDQRIHQLINRITQQGGKVAAICAAPQVLAHNGIANGKTITCYPGALKAEQWPEITITANPVEVDENVITSRGPGTAIDFALTLITHLAGETVRQEVETGLVR
jgi:4-methyl-5(b-hydroxyethyl)-thiazole monophosphate biosynthesis